jgi:hypothetical protein
MPVTFIQRPAPTLRTFGVAAVVVGAGVAVFAVVWADAVWVPAAVAVVLLVLGAFALALFVLTPDLGVTCTEDAVSVFERRRLRGRQEAAIAGWNEITDTTVRESDAIGGGTWFSIRARGAPLIALREDLTDGWDDFVALCNARAAHTRSVWLPADDPSVEGDRVRVGDEHVSVLTRAGGYVEVARTPRLSRDLG